MRVTWGLAAMLVVAFGVATPAIAAPALVQQNCLQKTGAVSTISVAMSSAVSQGDLLVAAIGFNSTTVTVTSITDTRGNTWTAAFPLVRNTNATFGQSLQTWYTTSGSSGADTITVTLSGNTATFGGLELLVHEYSGIAPIAPLTKTATGSSNMPSAGSITTANPNAVMVSQVMHQNTITGVAAPFTLRGTCGDATADYIPPSAGTNAATFSASSNAQWTAALVAFDAPPPKANGATCSFGSECVSTFCVDGVCCGTACGGNNTADCQGCSQAATGDTTSPDGTCTFVAASHVCRSSAGPCDVAENCSGASAACPADTFASSSTVCRSSAGACDVQETCTGTTATCPADSFAPASTVCRSTAGPCDVAENCTGSSATCPADGFAASTLVCRPSADVCDVAEQCTGSSAACPADAFAPPSVQCRASAGVCDVAESCTGTATACPPDGFAASTVTCRPAATICDVAESCTGSSAACPADAFAASTVVCRSSAGVCDVPENCTGASSVCPNDALVPASTECRATAGPCDVAEQCDGLSPNCPTDAFASAATVCRPDAGACDLAENCTGSSAACPADSFVAAGVECRPDAGVCDVAEDCTGTSGACPPDSFAPPSVTCRNSAGPCDVAESCTGAGAACPADSFAAATVVCRPDAGMCDLAETCTGNSAACPTDVLVPASTECRALAGPCDVPEECDGVSPACPVDGFAAATVVCRADAGSCDLAESCTGSSAACPADSFVAAGVECRPDAGVCDVPESCTGTSPTCPPDGFAAPTVTCRAAASNCDVAETCTGASPSCPSDALAADGTSCADPSFCNGAETCASGTCTAGTPVSCVDPFGEEVLSCDDTTMACVAVPNAAPQIVHDALLTGAVGVPWPYNALGRMKVLGSKPLSYAACGGPASFHVDALTGAVTWTPTVEGTVSLCVSAKNAAGSDSYSFDVTIGPAAGAGPTASFTVTPSTNPAPLDAAFDGSASTSDPSTPLFAWRWDFGEGGAPGSDVTTSATYRAVAGYRPELTVIDSAGRLDSTKRDVRVTRADGHRPPIARIVADKAQGDQALEVALHCDCDAPDAPIAAYDWWFGDATSYEAAPSHTFAPGRYRIRLLVVDANGLTAEDTQEIVVTRGSARPPTCRLFAEPPQFDAPASTRIRALFGDDAVVTRHELTFDDANTSQEVDVTRDYSTAGRYPVRLRVEDDEGLPCFDSIAIRALTAGAHEAPAIVGLTELTAECGRAFEQTFTFAGTAPATWRIVDGAPDGATIDPQTGTFRWTARSDDLSDRTMTIAADGPDGTATAKVLLHSDCSERTKLAVGCGCGTGSTSSAGLVACGVIVLVAGSLRRRRR